MIKLTRIKKLIFILLILLISITLFSCGKEKKGEGEFSFLLYSDNVLAFDNDEELIIDSDSLYQNVSKVVVNENGYLVLKIEDDFYFSIGENSEILINKNGNNISIEVVKGEFLYETKKENNISIKFDNYSFSPNISSSFVVVGNKASNIINLLNSVTLDIGDTIDISKSLKDNIDNSKLSTLINKYIELDITYSDRLTSIGWYINKDGLWQFLEEVEEKKDVIKGDDNLPDMELSIGNTLKIYNKQVQYPSVTCSVTKKTTISYKVGSEGKWQNDIPGFKDSGIYEIFIKVENPSYETYETSFNFEIEKAYQVVNILNLDLTYDKLNHSVLVQCSETDGTTISFKKSGESAYSSNNPEFKDAGKYQIGIKVENPNYYDFESEVTLEIKKGTFIVTANDLNVTYDGTSHKSDILASDTLGTTISYKVKLSDSWSKVEPSFTNSGSYTIYYKIENPNYTTYEGSYNLLINKANFTINANDLNLEYDKNAHNIEVEVSGVTGVELEYKVGENSWTKTKPTFTNVCSTTVTIKGTKANFNDCEITINVNITKGTLVGSIDNINVTYDKKEHYSNLTISDTNGTKIYYRKSESDSWSEASPKFIDSGNYIVFIKAENDNYTTYETSYTVTINKAELTLTASNIDLTYDKASHKSTISVSDSTGTTISYKIGEGNWTIEEPSFKDVVDVTVYVKAENKNYNLKETSFTCSIKKADLTLTVTDISACFNTKEFSSPAKVSDSNGTTILYKVGTDGEWSETVPTFKDAVEVTVYVKAENKNYNTIESSYTVTITQVPIGISIYGNNVEYDGKSHKPICSILNNIDGTVEVLWKKEGDTEWSSEAPEFTDVISQKVYVKAGGGNYTTKEKSFTFTISKGTFLVSSTIMVAYSGSPLTVSFIPSNIKEGNTYYYRKGTSGAWSETAPSYTNKGTYTGYIKIENPNCETYTSKYTFIIASTDLTVYASVRSDGSMKCTCHVFGYSYDIGDCYIYDIDRKKVYATTNRVEEEVGSFISDGLDISTLEAGTYNLLFGVDKLDSNLEENRFYIYKLIVNEDGTYSFENKEVISDSTKVKNYVSLINKYK